MYRQYTEEELDRLPERETYIHVRYNPHFPRVHKYLGTLGLKEKGKFLRWLIEAWATGKIVEKGK